MLFSFKFFAQKNEFQKGSKFSLSNKLEKHNKLYSFKNKDLQKFLKNFLIAFRKLVENLNAVKEELV
jgi:hypothetical protein